ncbi:DM13 domain-containing protein [Flavobacterium terrigena]|uniref:Electron transfer DM13 n=1 Tax=Flavobacterium terrigena TaxID=402734 RepID=A0A1H6WF32_9FLAO|nr:DM13 domain-containing protein [Flavobacterium terrigena]SEJ11112.1 Electron transfer DM13 [Flavobacterium terrigena]
MKKILALQILLFVIISCEKEGEFAQTNNQTINLNSAVLLKTGQFTTTSGISGSGNVNIYSVNNQRKLILENYTIENGPDLKVYLSTTDAPNTFVNLGNLDVETVYTIPNSVDLNVYKYVLIHCQQFNHLYAIALLN